MYFIKCKSKFDNQNRYVGIDVHGNIVYYTGIGIYSGNPDWRPQVFCTKEDAENTIAIITSNNYYDFKVIKSFVIY